MLCYYDLCNVLTSCQPGTTIWRKIGVYCILHFKNLSCNSLGNKSLFKNGAFQAGNSALTSHHALKVTQDVSYTYINVKR